MTEETKKILKRWLWADYMLYNHFRNKLKMAINNHDEGIMASRF